MAPRSRVARCPYPEADCAAHAASLLGVIAATGVAAVGVCLGRQRVVWSSGRTEGPVGAWVAAAMRTGTTRAELFPGFRQHLAAIGRDDGDGEPFLTILPNDGVPLPAQARMQVIDRTPRLEPHLVLVSLRDYVDARAGLPPFEVAIHRTLISGMELEAAVTSTNLRVTWSSPAFATRAGVGDVLGRALAEVTSAQERDVLVDLARQATQRRHARAALSRTLTTGRKVSVVDATHDPAIAGLLWWWQPEAGSLADPDRLVAIEAATTRFIDELAWAGVDTARLHTSAVGRLGPTAALTSREREILEMLTSGLRVPSIAARLFISPSTVRNHLSTAFRKIGVASQAEFFERVAATSGGTKRATRQRTRTPRQPEP
ncbi:MAG TPA: helix-turn-helix transcriptional regulator [Acidimicrobiales bacterium]